MGETAAPIQSADLSGIIERLEKATGPDRELDGDLHNAVYGTAYIRAPASVTGFFTAVGDNGCPTVPYFTGSVDAAMVLAERVTAAQINVTKYSDTIAKASFGASGMQPVMHVTPALALCLATLRALQSKGEA